MSVWRLVEIQMPSATEPLRFALRKDILRDVRRREGRYLLRTNLTDTNPANVYSETAGFEMCCNFFGTEHTIINSDFIYLAFEIGNIVTVPSNE